MQYVERTLQVKSALLERPDLLEKIRAIFTSHIAIDGVRESIGEGDNRKVYVVGECEISLDTNISFPFYGVI